VNGHIFLGSDALGNSDRRRHYREVETWGEECAERTGCVVFPDETGEAIIAQATSLYQDTQWGD